MPINMSYCQFENTYKAMLECKESLDNDDLEQLEQSASKEEKEYIWKFIDLCMEIATEYK